MNSNTWKEALVFTRSERIGIIILIMLGILSLAYSYFLPDWISSKKINQFEKEHAAELLFAREENLKIDEEIPSTKYVEFQKDSTTNSGYYPKKKYSKEIKEFQPVNININEVTAQNLIKAGLEAEVAFRIIKFRDGLGGFYEIHQLKDVFGLSEIDYEKIKNNHVLNVNQIQKMNLNSATYEELNAHPFISEKLANQIIGFRTKFKAFESKEDVQKLYLVDEVLYAKLIHYVTF
jgi:competence protein ComEA